MDQSQQRGPWFQTYTGGQFYPVVPHVDEVRFIDIAHALSHVCRFGGHVREFYSVAQHSVLVSRVVPAEHALWGLFHDAAEAYVGDMVAPIKRLQVMRPYCEVEKRVLRVIAQKFELPLPADGRPGLVGSDADLVPAEVKVADTRMLFTEKRDLRALPPNTDLPEWEGVKDHPPYDLAVVPLSPDAAKDLFIRRFNELTAERDAQRCSLCKGRGFTTQEVVLHEEGAVVRSPVTCVGCGGSGRARRVA